MESYPNCPKYIQRHLSHVKDTPSCLAQKQGNPSLRAAGMDRIGRYDFVAVPIRLVVWYLSSRGNPGFRILITGCFAFQTTVEQHVQHFGQLCSQSFFCCFFFFFLLAAAPTQLIGQTTIQWNLDDPIHSTGGTHRYWDFEIKEWLETDLLNLCTGSFLTIPSQ